MVKAHGSFARTFLLKVFQAEFSVFTPVLPQFGAYRSGHARLSAMAASQGFKIPQSVLVVIYTADLDVLLLRRADAPELPFWQSVTGSKDSTSESYRATAVREVGEETGIDCGPDSALDSALQDWQLENIYSIYPRWLHRYAPGVLQNTERVFGLQLPAHWVRSAVRLSPREHSDYVWLQLHAAAERCFAPSNAEAILLAPRFAAAPAPCGSRHE